MPARPDRSWIVGDGDSDVPLPVLCGVPTAAAPCVVCELAAEPFVPEPNSAQPPTTAPVATTAALPNQA
ncbi:hypothetical protein [Actinocrinis sp.]|uniref:hypothetical protein n=1 Tax=Actinocrinis sp. TaxID=1920516 RepID=UPI002D428550|nr:hypothetical protein [Actinocrinis sp.]HZP50030.1 hypothetical protein [Actinocrinis sp.]